MTAMKWASYKGNVDVVRAFIQHGVDVNSVDPTGLTALHDAVRKDHADVVDILLEAGANIDQQSDFGWTPLHLALTSGAPQATLALLKRGATVDLRNTRGRAPLHVGAARTGKYGVDECVNRMLIWGAEEKFVDNDGQTAADLIGREVDGNELTPEEFERVQKLLESAPADKAWRRRGLMVLCRAHPDRLRLTAEGSPRHAVMVTKTGAENVPSDVQTTGASVTGGFLDGMAGDDFARMVGTLLDFQIDDVFRNIVSYL